MEYKKVTLVIKKKKKALNILLQEFHNRKTSIS